MDNVQPQSPPQPLSGTAVPTPVALGVHNRLSAAEWRATLAIALLSGLRMLGMFMVVPVLASWAGQIADATPWRIGLAIGCYGLAQALCQIPFGWLSDRIGRRLVIAVGLLLMGLGSVVAACWPSIWGIIIGRTLQGAGAISGPLMALLADHTRDNVRTRAMAVVGMSFGLTFALALVCGPLLARFIGIGGIFWVIAGLAMLSLGVLLWVVPAAPSRVSRDTRVLSSGLRPIWQSLPLRRLNLSILMLHLVLMLTFQALPALLTALGWARSQHWEPYALAMGVSMLAVVPLIIVAEKRHHLRQALLGSALLLALVQGMWGIWPLQGWLVYVALGLFFTGFNLLEAVLPSLVSRLAPPGLKGTAMGLYATSQYLGIALGGAIGGAVGQHWGNSALFAVAALLALVWWAACRDLPEPGTLRTVRLPWPQAGDSQAGKASAQHLGQLPGVLAVVMARDEGCLYVRIDSRLQSADSLRSALGD